MLRTKLFRGFALLVILFSALSAILSVRTISRRVLDEAQTRVRLDLASARAVFEDRLNDISLVLRLVAAKQIVTEACEKGVWDDAAVRSRLERIRIGFGLDFLDIVAPDGKVVVRTTAPYATGDFHAANTAVAGALKGQVMEGLALLTRAELAQEAPGLAEQAFIELEDTPRARRSPRTEETRGMVMVGAVPVQQGASVLGAVYGGVLLNRNHALVDAIQDTIYENEQYRNTPVGTTTIFLMDGRIATTVRLANGNRAIGTRVSKEVAESVLDNGRVWVDEAFVVRDWYLTAYEPLRDGTGGIIGMLYVGVLKRPFMDAAHRLAVTYLFLSLFVLVVALLLAFVLAGRLSRPIHRLVEASNRMKGGERPPPVSTENACRETETLIVAFNAMTATLAEREERLKALNRSYMETLGFVSHELKSPVASIMNYAYLMRELKLGPLSERQERAVRAIEGGSRRLVEMVRHYLNLSRIENGEMAPVRTRVEVGTEVVRPVIEGLETQRAEKGMTVENAVGDGVVLDADLNMVREIFENLVGNAIKYGRQGGRVVLRAEPDSEWVRFAVWNEGPGIPADRIGALFQKFVRIQDAAHVKAQKGTGLGLFISRHIVEQHGGTIVARSQAGEWAEFEFTLPLYRRPNEEVT